MWMKTESRGEGEGGGDQIKKRSWGFFLHCLFTKIWKALIKVSLPLSTQVDIGTVHVTNAPGLSLLFLHILSRVTAVREGVLY